MQFYQYITDFIFVEDEPQRTDMIFVPGGNYPEAAQRASALYCAGYAPYVMPSGKYSILKGKFEPPEDAAEQNGKPDAIGEEKAGAQEAEAGRRYATEWEYLRDILLRGGVPDAAILREDQATYTYENAICSRRCVQELGLDVRRAILCCQAFHARRCLLYYQEQFPDTEFLVCPVVTKGISRETWHRTEHGIDTVLGEVERCGAQFHEILRNHMKDE